MQRAAFALLVVGWWDRSRAVRAGGAAAAGPGPEFVSSAVHVDRRAGRGVRDELAGIPPENLHIEFMDARRMVDDANIWTAARTCTVTDARFRPNIIISSDDSALNFLLQRRDLCSPGSRSSFAGSTPELPRSSEAVPNMTGILEGLAVAENLQLIDACIPTASRVVLLADRTSLGQGMVQVARAAIRAIRRPVAENRDLG